MWHYPAHMDVNSHSELSPLARAFAAELRAERAAVGLTQVELAKRAGLSRSTLVRLEDEARQMNSDQMWQLCRALGVSIADFATRAESRLLKAEALERREVAGE